MFPFGHIGITLALWVAMAYVIRHRPMKYDLWLIVFASMLPDIIDKPIGHLIFTELNDGRLVCHTLLFLICFGLVAYILIKKRIQWAWAWPLFFGVNIHLLLDRFWEGPMAFWPMTGGFFPRGEGNILNTWIEILLHDPYVQFGEVIGLILLVSVIIYVKLQKPAVVFTTPTLAN